MVSTQREKYNIRRINERWGRNFPEFSIPKFFLVSEADGIRSHTLMTSKKIKIHKSIQSFAFNKKKYWKFTD